MGRVIGAVIAAYVAMMAIIFVLATGMWMVLGPSGSFQAGSWRTSGLWIAGSGVCGLVAAIPASRLASIIAQGDRRALQGFALLILALGFLFAIPVVTRTTGTIAGRPDLVSMQEAMSKAAQPIWLALILPVLGVIGAVVGWKHRAVEV